MKQCVREAIARPEASDDAKTTFENEAPKPSVAAAPQTINTYRKDAKHSEMIALLMKFKKNFKKRSRHRLYNFRADSARFN